MSLNDNLTKTVRGEVATVTYRSQKGTFPDLLRVVANDAEVGWEPVSLSFNVEEDGTMVFIATVAAEKEGKYVPSETPKQIQTSTPIGQKRQPKLVDFDEE